jgi:hypothetical protein
MKSHYASAALTIVCLAVIHSQPQAAEYVGPATAPQEPATATTTGPVPTATDSLRTVPRNAYESRPAVGIPARTIFRDKGAPYYDNLRDLSVSPEVRASDSLRLSTNIDLPDFRGSFPLLQRGFAPEEADLKIGPIYFKLRHLSAAVLASDNIEHSEDDRESDVIGIVSVGGQILAQLSEGFQIAASGTFVYLPFEGEAGFNGFGLRSPYSFGVAASPTARTQVIWQPVVFGLPLTIADEFTVGMARFSNGAYDGFSIYDGSNFDEQDRAGIYTFGARGAGEADFRSTTIDEDTEILYYSNEISLSTYAYLPGQNLFRFRASHENLWYDGDEDRYELASVRDRVFASIESVRENLRFKPYIRYDYFHRDNPEINNHRAFVGVRGPITDLLYFRGEIGAVWRTEEDQQDLLWRLGLYHQPGPYTWQSLEYQRDLSDFQDELRQQVIYRINKTLGPELSASAYTSYGWIEDEIDSGFDRTEWRSGIRFTYLASPRTTFRLSGQHTYIDYEDGSEEYNSFRLRLECSHRFAGPFQARAIYQFEERDSDRRGRDYYENLAYLSISYLFD